MVSQLICRSVLVTTAGTALLLAASLTTQAGTITPPSKGVIVQGLNSDLTDVRWRRCWRDRWGRMRCTWCWRDRWGRVRCG
jgi:hypothetical protein